MKPRIFVSSTFYDLKFIREDLSNFIKAHDFEPIMFEDGDIGYTPGKELDFSCYENMKNSDMVLLIIGGEYGSPATGEQADNFEEYISVTRNEFRAAVEAGIPIYVFVESSVYAEYGVYEVNYSNIEKKKIKIEFKATKNINIFRFIKEIRTLSDKPIQEFRRSSDIKSFLSKQWSDMFKNYLELLKKNKENASLQNTVADMQTLIKQMNIMLDAVGQKVIGDNDANHYKDIIQKQNTVEAKRIAQLIADELDVKVLSNCDHSIIKHRVNNINNLLYVLEKVYNDISAEFASDDSDIEFNADKVFHSLLLNCHKKELDLCQVSLNFINSLPDVVKVLKSKGSKEYVINKLATPYMYRKLFLMSEIVRANEYNEKLVSEDAKVTT